MKPNSKITAFEATANVELPVVAPAPVARLSSAKLRILIVDDHAIVREGLSQILKLGFPEAVVGQGSDATQALEQAEKKTWDVILLDISMPGRSGLDIIRQINVFQPNAKILVLSMHPEDHYAMRVLKAGAVGYLTKETASTEVVNAINKARAGGKYVSSQLADKLVAGLQQPQITAAHETLSDREYQVMRLIAGAKSLKQIGFDLKLSVKTVGTYRTRVLQKLKLESNAQIIRYALRENLVQ